MDFAKDLKDSIDIIKNNGKLYSNIKSFLQSPQIRFFALTTGKNRGIVSMAQKGCGNANHRIDSIQHTIRR